MFYFAYGSNLNHKRMKNRCKEAKYLQSYTLKGYKLIFSFRDPAEPYGYANIEKKVNSKVPGAIWKITKKDEIKLDGYEGVHIGSYDKEYFNWKGKKVLVYIQKDYIKKIPNPWYLHIIIRGYKDCILDLNYLKNRVSFYSSIKYPIKW